MVEAKTVTTKVTPRTLLLARKISAKTGEKLYKVLERMVEAGYQNHVIKNGAKK